MAKDPEPEEAPPARGKTKLVLTIVLAVAVVVSTGIGAALMLSGDDEVEAAAAEEETLEARVPRGAPIYVALDPAFVVNFQDKNQRNKFLKAELSVVTRDPAVEQAITKHLPAIRNTLVLLFSRQIYEDLVPHEGKEQLRAAALAEVRNVLEQQTGDPGVEDLYFSSLVMQ